MLTNNLAEQKLAAAHHSAGAGVRARSGKRRDKQFEHDLVALAPHLLAFARGLCGRPDYADDLVQEASTRAWAARERFTPGTNMKAWTFTILRNYYLSEIRRSKRQVDMEDDAVERMLVMEPDQERRLHLFDLDEALDQLPPERREAVLLIGAGGLSYEEAALIEDCAIGTMKSRVSRARSELGRLLETEPVQPVNRSAT